jgi:hypothetical protein
VRDAFDRLFVRMLQKRLANEDLTGEQLAALSKINSDHEQIAKVRERRARRRRGELKAKSGDYLACRNMTGKGKNPFRGFSMWNFRLRSRQRSHCSWQPDLLRRMVFTAMALHNHFRVHNPTVRVTKELARTVTARTESYRGARNPRTAYHSHD